MSLITKVDDHGVKEYRTGFLLVCTIAAIILTVTGGGYALYIVEAGAGSANIQTYRDGTWTVTMIMTTIGFGDYYPTTDAGRYIGWIVFVLGALELGSLIGIASNAMGTDSSIQNRELRTMLAEVMRKLEHEEKATGRCTAVNSDSHNLDCVFDQVHYSSNRLSDGYLTIGKDSTGIYMLAVDAYDNETGQEIHRWIPANSREELRVMFKRFQEKDNEL